METTFTPLASLAGGVLIGIAALILMLFVGRIAGATGILAGTIFPSDAKDWGWRAAFLLGMVSAPTIAAMTALPVQPIVVPTGSAMLIAGGIIVGCGVTLASGCTSGHGVCGLARLSARSLVATLVFMVTTGITVYLVRHVMGA